MGRVVSTQSTWGHIRIFKMKFGIVLLMLFAAASALRLPARKIISFDDCPGTINVAPVKKSLSFNAKKCPDPVPAQKMEKSPNKNSLMPSKIVNFRMLHTFLFYFDYFDHFLNKLH